VIGELMGNNSDRWHIAQEYEKEWWKRRSSHIDFQFYKNYADEMRQFCDNRIKFSKRTKILEIGSGAAGILTFITESEERYAVDPLEYFYSSVPEFKKKRDANVKYLTAKGEDLSFSKNFFDLIIMDNVLDHCDDPEKVIYEAKRVLRDGGLIYFKQNTYHIWGKFIRVIMEKMTIDKGHPFTFSKNDINNLLKKYEFNILKYRRSGFFPTWKRELTSGNKKDLVKALLLVTRDKVSFLIEKPGI
jgi:SAM-dependent methyltransferase